MWYIAKKGFSLFSNLLRIGAYGAFLFSAYSTHETSIRELQEMLNDMDTMKTEWQDTVMDTSVLKLHLDEVGYSSRFLGPWVDKTATFPVWNKALINRRFLSMVWSFERTHDPTELAKTMDEWEKGVKRWKGLIEALESTDDVFWDTRQERRALKDITYMISKGRNILKQHVTDKEENAKLIAKTVPQ